MGDKEHGQSMEQVSGAIDSFIGRMVSMVTGLGGDLKTALVRIQALEAKVAELEATAKEEV